MVMISALLMHSPLYQQRRTKVAITVPAAMRAVITKAPGCFKNRLARLGIEYRTRRLEGHFQRAFSTSVV
jgi:hypothetical protein